MQDIELSSHAKDMLSEREIPEEWIWRTINSADRTEMGRDNNTHYLKAIPEKDSRILRVVVNTHVKPNRVVTIFFDRRLRRKT